jgi:hypothetical protein
VGKDKVRRITNSIDKRIKTRATIASGHARRLINGEVPLVCLIPVLFVFSISYSLMSCLETSVSEQLPLKNAVLQG